MDARSQEYRLHNSYSTKLEPLEAAQQDALHMLSVAVNWPHRPQDLAFLLALGQGFIAHDPIERPLGTGMWFAHAPDAATIGMMITHPKLQAGGLGREILNAIEARLGDSKMRLNATKSGWRLYRAAGFEETGAVVQYQGMVDRSVSARDDRSMRVVGKADRAQIEALDSQILGTPRPAAFERLWQVSQGVVIEEAGEVSGFALYRSFGRGRLIGPMVARSEEEAIALVAHVAQETEGFLRLDADRRHADLGKYLNRIGLGSFDTVVPMTKGGHYGPEAAPNHVYAVASQTLG